jgi:tetratricopeptide (TPR) repeat protein
MHHRIHKGGVAAGMVLLAFCFAMRAAPQQADEKPKNLQYFPKDTTRQALVQRMRGFSFALGTRCEHCHVEKTPGSHDLDFAADDKQEKKTARAMLKMVDAINQEYIAKMGRTAPMRVECVTCHRGLTIPKTMNALLAETIEKKGVDAAIAQYRELRRNGLGDGQYDFGETALNILTESLLHENKGKEAAAIMELNVEVNTPPSLWALHLSGQAHIANHENEKAIEDYKKILEENPKDEFAKKQLNFLQGNKPSANGSQRD